jgi:hypothetical protein
MLFKKKITSHIPALYELSRNFPLKLQKNRFYFLYKNHFKHKNKVILEAQETIFVIWCNRVTVVALV